MPEANSLSVGDNVGELKVVENSPRRLRLAFPQVFPLVCILIGLAAWVAFVSMILPNVHEHGILDGFFSGGRLGKICLGIGAGGIIVGISQLGVSYTFDGDVLTVTRTRLITVWTRSTEAFESVLVSVSHDGPLEILVLALVPQAGKPLILAVNPSDKRGLPLVAAAGRISELLGLPIVRQGTPVQGNIKS